MWGHALRELLVKEVLDLHALAALGAAHEARPVALKVLVVEPGPGGLGPASTSDL